MLCKDKVLRPKQNLTNVNKIKVGDAQFNQSQQKDSVNDTDETRMTMLSPGIYSHHQFTAMEQQQLAYPKDWTRSPMFNQPNTQPFSNPVRSLI